MNHDELLKQHPNYRAMLPVYGRIAPLMSGTDAMRKSGKMLLPPYPAEKDDAWEDRLKRSWLFGALSDTIARHAGKPFSRPVQVKNAEGLALIEPIAKDVDGEGQDLTSFSRILWVDAESYGYSHVLVDRPAVEAESRADELASGISPRFVHVSAAALYFWDSMRTSAGRELTEIRYFAGDDHIMRWTLEAWELYEMVDREYKLKDSGPNPHGKINLVSLYFHRLGFMTAKPPLSALAELNIQHWQDSSDQANIERTARCGILFASGFDEDAAGKIKIGPKSLVSHSDPVAKLQTVEFSGSAVSIGREAIKHLEAQMEQLGMKPEMSRNVDSTATSAMINESQATTDVATWALELQMALVRCYEIAAEITGDTLPEDFAVEVFRDFAVAGSAADMGPIVSMGQSGLLSAEGVQAEAKRRGVLAPDHDIEADVARISTGGMTALPAF